MSDLKHSVLPKDLSLVLKVAIFLLFILTSAQTFQISPVKLKSAKKKPIQIMTMFSNSSYLSRDLYYSQRPFWWNFTPSIVSLLLHRQMKEQGNFTPQSFFHLHYLTFNCYHLSADWTTRDPCQLAQFPVEDP